MNVKELLRNAGYLGVAALVSYAATATAESPDKFAATPPSGWDHLCTGNAIQVKPTPVSRIYSGSGTCWVNVTNGDKSDSAQQQWVNAKVTLSGSFAIQSNTFSELLTFAIPAQTSSSQGGGSVSSGGIAKVHVSGACNGDPWESPAQCTSTAPNLDLYRSFGWTFTPPSGPLSRNVFGPGLVQALLSNQESKPPLSPVDLDAVRWPATDGKGTVGRVFWRVPDVSGNRWILRFDVEASMNSADSAYFKVGQVSGPGATTNLSPGQIAKLFWTPSKLQAAEYYFRVCSVNDVGRQCSASVKARNPTHAELISTESHKFTTAGIGGKSGGTPTVPSSLTGRHIALGTAIGNSGGAPGTARPPSAALGSARGVQTIGPESTMSASGSRPVAAGAKPALMTAHGSPLPALTFTIVSVQNRTYPVTGAPNSIIVEDPPAGRNAGACSQAFSFPVQLIVKNVGQADFNPGITWAAVVAHVGNWSDVKHFTTLHKGESQVMNFNVSVPPGKYALQAAVTLPKDMSVSHSDNPSLSWPLDVICDFREVTPSRLAPPASSGRASASSMPAPHALMPTARPAPR